jgi:hypothetical protein
VIEKSNLDLHTVISLSGLDNSCVFAHILFLFGQQDLLISDGVQFFDCSDVGSSCWPKL